VRERTREYGVLRAIGFLPKHIATLVLGEAAVIGVLGGVLGVAVCYPLIDGALGPLMEDNFTGFFPYFRLSDSDVLIALAVSAVVASIAAIVPAWQASKLD